MPMNIEIAKSSNTLNDNISYLQRTTAEYTPLADLDFGANPIDYILITTGSLRKGDGIRRTFTGEGSRINGQPVPLAELQKYWNRNIFNGNGALPLDSDPLCLGEIGGVKVFMCPSGGESSNSLPDEAANEKMEYFKTHSLDQFVAVNGNDGLVFALDTEVKINETSHPKLMTAAEVNMYCQQELTHAVLGRLEDIITGTDMRVQSVTAIAGYSVGTRQDLLKVCRYNMTIPENYEDISLLVDPHASVGGVLQQMVDWEQTFPDEKQAWRQFVGFVGMPVEVLEMAALVSKHRKIN